jgi:hypothetical protein
MTPRCALVLLAAAVAVLTAVLTAAAAGYLARLDHATYPKALTRAATAFASTLTLAAALACALHTLAR